MLRVRAQPRLGCGAKWGAGHTWEKIPILAEKFRPQGNPWMPLAFTLHARVLTLTPPLLNEMRNEICTDISRRSHGAWSRRPVAGYGLSGLLSWTRLGGAQGRRG